MVTFYVLIFILPCLLSLWVIEMIYFEKAVRSYKHFS